MKKILIGYISNVKGSGLDNYIYQLVDLLKGEDVQIDLLSSAIDQELNDKYNADPNVRVLPIDRIPHPKKRYDQIKKYAIDNQYDIAYFNISEAFNCIGNLACKGIVPIIISHSHSAGNDNENKIKREISKIMHFASRPLLNHSSTAKFACSDLAAKWLYGSNKPYRLIRNTIKAKRFRYAEKDRKEIRQQLKVSEDQQVLGFVGSLTYSKNPVVLLELMKALNKNTNRYVLWIIGDGPLRNVLEQKAKDENIQGVHFLGKRFDIEKYYSAMDLFVLPSNFEGYPLVGVEAQANGLPCLFSDHITKDIAFSDHSQFFDTKNIEEGAQKAKHLLKMGRIDPKKYDPKILYNLKDQKQEFIDIFTKEEI